MEFTLEACDKKTGARAGMITTGHGRIPTPVFMPVGTGGTVKAVSNQMLRGEVGTGILLANTYHLYLRPGMDVLREARGLHGFMDWDGVLLTDSGGYQVFSLADNRKLQEDGVVFHSHIDGSRHMFTPESVVDIQRIIGSDIMMALDECTPYPVSEKDARKSMDLTHRWLLRGWERYRNTSPFYGYSQSFFPIVQGSVFPELRKESAEFVARLEAEGYAIGGLSVGEPVEEMYRMTERVNAILPAGKPRYLMGVGTPANLLESVARGVDMFDCVMPTRNARNGMLFTSEGMIHIRNKKWQHDFSAIDPAGPTSYSRYSKAYLRHLAVSNEIMASVIASVHNLGLYVRLLQECRERIIDGSFGTWKEQIIPKLMRKL
ncbi:MAG TPA: tRNA guanosine(34) transglycosylase Tgt [Bacteroidetes bacterium]|nr:tRNA guanosine(34) transglycosylase Tgt [Bacteroidota bacterium]